MEAKDESIIARRTRIDPPDLYGPVVMVSRPPVRRYQSCCISRKVRTAAGSIPARVSRYSRNGAVLLPVFRGGNEKRKCSDAVPGGGREMLVAEVAQLVEQPGSRMHARHIAWEYAGSIPALGPLFV